MGKYLITGATGNVGREVITALEHRDVQLVAALATQQDVDSWSKSEAVLFDFGNKDTWVKALNDVDAVFLMRPPAIADVKTYLFPFIDYCIERSVTHIVFLSLQGVQFNIFTPHHKVEKYMRSKKVPYTFIRPNFFMQNLSTVYAQDIKNNSEIFLPAGNGKTAFIDVRDIGAAVGTVLGKTEHIGKAYTLSGGKALDYWQIADIVSKTLGRTITYKNPSVKEYTARLLANNSPADYVKVQKMLYFVVRHNFSASTKSDVQSLLRREPISFEQFANDYAAVWR